MRPAGLFCSEQFHRTVIIGVIAVAVVKLAVMDIIHVRAVLHHGVFLTRMAMGMGIGGNAGDELFISRIGRAHFERMFIDMAAMRIVEMAIMEVIDMARVIERGVTAA
jgi:hypothetical protein